MKYQNFDHYILPEVKLFLEELRKLGFVVAIVGGTVRDYFLNNKNKHDYDVELRPGFLKNFEVEFFKLKSLSNYQIEELKYGILRLSAPKFEIELSMPRKEIFEGEFSHSNFKAIFIEDPSFEQGVLRRDFTINSMAMVLNDDWQLKDPLNGLKDLDNKILKACSEDFYKDPVRFLRATRFCVLYGFEIENSILKAFKTLNKKSFSPFYLRKECLKSKAPLSFFSHLFKFLDLFKNKKEDFLLKNEKYHGEKLEQHLQKHLYLDQEFFNILCSLLKIKPIKSFKEEDLSCEFLKNVNESNFMQYEKELRPFIRFFSLSDGTKDNLNHFYNLNFDLALIDKESFHLKSITPQHRKYFQTFKQLMQVLKC